MKLLSLFSGIGAFEKALTNLGISYELVGFSEVDKWAIESYCAIHGVDKNLNLGDVSEVENKDLPQADMVTYGFPCQDISIAGKQKGISSGTRSGLLYEAERVIDHIKPKYAIAENVKNLVGKKFKGDFDELLKRLDSYGYNNYWKVLNSKDYGVPQNRERVFIVSIRKDIDDCKFKFPKPQELELTLRDMLEDKVEDKYNISKSNLRKLKEIHKYFPKRDFLIGGMQKNQSIKTDGICTTLTSSMGLGGGYVPMVNCITGSLLRKLTPLECWRLMGFEDKDYWKARNRLEKVFYNGKPRSDSQMYKQAGNSIVVNVLEEIFKE